MHKYVFSDSIYDSDDDSDDSSGLNSIKEDLDRASSKSDDNKNRKEEPTPEFASRDAYQYDFYTTLDIAA